MFTTQSQVGKSPTRGHGCGQDEVPVFAGAGVVAPEDDSTWLNETGLQLPVSTAIIKTRETAFHNPLVFIFVISS
jgi:hypothetical protein